jgi:hypothetical protein
MNDAINLQHDLRPAIAGGMSRVGLAAGAVGMAFRRQAGDTR